MKDIELKRKGEPETTCCRGGHQDGAVLIEFALVLPLLLVLLLGMVEFGRAFNYWIDETHLANVAARWAAVGKVPDKTWLSEEADTKELAEGAVMRLCLPNASKKVGEPVRAEIDYSFKWMPYIGEAMGGITETLLSANATMRIEQVPAGVEAPC